MSLRRAVPMLQGLAGKTTATAGPGQGLLLGSLVDMLLTKIHFIFHLFDFVSGEAMGTIH